MSRYSIKEASELIWLPESTLRYYETMWLIDWIERDISSWHRVYSEENIQYFSWIACLNATWMSISDMKKYIEWFKNGNIIPEKQIALLQKQEKNIAQEQKELKIRKNYIKAKIKYWGLVNSTDMQSFEKVKEEIMVLAKELKKESKK